MQQPTVKRRRGKAGEAGYTLLAVIFILFTLTIWLSVAMPKVIKQLQRDQELETYERGQQYIRAIQLYYHKFRSFPPNIDLLVKSNNIRYLRKKYKDPTTGKDDWKIIRYGQAKTQTLGFFGKPLMGGGGLGGGIGPVAGQGNNLFGGNPTDSSQSGQTGSSSSGTTGTGTDQSSQNLTQPNNQSSSGSSIFAQQQQSSFGQNGQSSNGLSGQTFGGGGIIGFSPNSPKATMITVRKRNKYSEWEFIFDPALEQYYASGAGAGGAQTNQPGYGFNPMGVGGNVNNGSNSGTAWGNSNNGSTDQNGSGSGTGQSGGQTGSGGGINQNGNSPFQ